MNDINRNKLIEKEHGESHELIRRRGSASSLSKKNNSEGDLLDLSLLWRYIFAHKTLIITITCFVMLVTYAANKIMLPTYESSSVIEIKQDNSFVGYEGVVEDDWVTRKHFIANQISFLKSNQVIERVIEILQLDRNPEFTGEMQQKGIISGIKGVIGLISDKTSNQTADLRTNAPESKLSNRQAQIISRFRSRLMVEKVEGTSHIIIKFSSFSPDLSAAIITTVTEAYRQLDSESAQSAQSIAQQALDNKLNEVQTRLTNSERNLTQFSRKTGIYDVDDRGNLANQKIQKLNEEYLTIQSEVISLSTLKEQQGSDKNWGMLASVLEDSNINLMKKEVANLEIEYAKLSHTYQSSYPILLELKEEILSITNNIALKEKEHVDALETKYLAALDKRMLIKQELERYNAELLDLKDRSVEFNLLKRDWESNKEIYDGLLERAKESGVSSGLKTAKVAIIDQAQVPLSPSAPKVMKNTIVSGLAGLFLLIGLAAAVGLMDRRIRTPEDLANLTTYPNLALIPLIKKVNNIELMVMHDSSPMFADVFKGLRTELTYSLPGGFPRSMMITSSLPSEAKTTTIVNLASVLQKSKKNRILVIDLDLRKPRLHKLFSLPQSPGVTDCLVDSEINLPIHESTELGFSILLAGTMSKNATELLESTQFDDLFTQLKNRYDIILVDSSPIMGLADPLVISTKVEAVLLAVSVGVSTTDSFSNAISKLESMDANIVGTIMTKFDYSGLSYNQYYYEDYQQEDS